MPKFITFTPTEWEIIDHRLDCPECLADALEHCTPYSRQAIERCAWSLHEHGRKDIVINPMRRRILVNCCEGSTFFAGMEEAVMDGTINKGKELAYYRAANSLENKLECNVARN